MRAPGAMRRRTRRRRRRAAEGARFVFDGDVLRKAGGRSPAPLAPWRGARIRTCPPAVSTTGSSPGRRQAGASPAAFAGRALVGPLGPRSSGPCHRRLAQDMALAQDTGPFETSPLRTPASRRRRFRAFFSARGITGKFYQFFPRLFSTVSADGRGLASLPSKRGSARGCVRVRLPARPVRRKARVRRAVEGQVTWTMLPSLYDDLPRRRRARGSRLRAAPSQAKEGGPSRARRRAAPSPRARGPSADGRRRLVVRAARGGSRASSAGARHRVLRPGGRDGRPVPRPRRAGHHAECGLVRPNELTRRRGGPRRRALAMAKPWYLLRPRRGHGEPCVVGERRFGARRAAE